MQAHLQILTQKTWVFLNLSPSICKQALATLHLQPDTVQNKARAGRGMYPELADDIN